MLRGLTLNWKQAIAYYFTANTSPESWFMDTCYNVLCNVRDCGFTVVGTVCDQGPANRGLYRDLKVGPAVPYFFNDGMKIYSLHDMPHLIKNVRTNLRNYDIHFTDLKENRTMVASWKDIEEFYEKDREQRFRVAPKLTYQHIYSKGLETMKVKLATQVFSHSVAAGLCVYASTGKLGSSALQTAEFVGTMNDLFDCMNSKQKFSKGFSSAISDDNGHVEFLEKCVKWVEGWKFMTPSGKTMKIPCQGGLVMTLKATLGIWDDLKKKNLSYLLTNRLNQDCVENAFSHIRRSGGFRDQPDCYQFRSSVRNVIVHEFLKKSNTNCEDDNDSNLLDLSKVHSSLANAITQAEEKNEEENMTDEFAPLFIDNLPVPTTTEIEDNVIMYIAGFVARKYLKKSKCDQCNEVLVLEKKELDRNYMLVYFKEYDPEDASSFGLKWATNEFFECLRDMGELFFRDIDKHIKKPGVRKIMSEIMQNVDFDFIHQTHKDEAKQFIIFSFITMMIKHKVRTLNGQNKIISESKKKKKKLNHVANV